MNAITGYNAGATGSGVTIAVLDSGVNPLSAEFAGRISAASRDVASTRTIDDTEGHGTSVAAVALAAKNDSGMHGVAFNATLLALRTDTPGSCDATDGCSHSDSNLARAIDIAVANGAKVINMSLGGSPANFTLRAAMGRATRAGTIIVISAGNDGAANPDELSLTALDTSIANGLILIAGAYGTAADPRAISDFSNRAGTGASQYVAALGYRVRAFDQTGTAFLYSGTSYSAPALSGAAALLFQAFPSLTATQIVDIIFRTADDAGAPGTDAIFGRGILNLTRAFSPIGSASLAGSAVAVSTSDNGALGSAFGTGGQLGQSLGGAIILDSYRRAFTADLGATLRLAPQRHPLADGLSLTPASLSLQGGRATLGFGFATPQTARPWVGEAQRGRDGGDEVRTRVRTGFIASDVAPATRLGFGIGQTPAELTRILAGDGGPAFLAATAGEAGGQLLQPGAAGAVSRSFGDWTLSLAAGQAEYLPTDATPGALIAANARRYGIESVMAGVARAAGPVRLRADIARQRESATLLGSRPGAVFGLAGGATTLFATAGADALLGSWRLGGEWRRGWTQAATGGGLLATLGTIASDAWRIDLSRGGAFAAGDSVALRLSQPLRVSRAAATLAVPVAWDYASGAATTELRAVDLAPTGRELDIEAAYAAPLGAGVLEANLYLRRDPGHRDGADADRGVALRYRVGF